MVKSGSHDPTTVFMSKPRLFIPITYHFSVRYIIRTGLLKAILPFSQPVIGLGWADEDLSRELQDMGVEVVRLPLSQFGADYSRLRRQIDTWYYDYRLRTVSTAINERRKNIGLPLSALLIKHTRRLMHHLKLQVPGAVSRMLAREERLVWEDTNLVEHDELIKQLNVQGVFSITPYHREEELVLRAAAFRHIPMCASIISFDNLTSRPWMPFIFDRYMVWNKYNATELLRAYPEVGSRSVDIVGPVQFDFYWKPEYVWSEKVWREELGLPENTQVILYAGGPEHQIPQEPIFVQQIDQAISSGEITGNPIILLRPHPVDDWNRWQSVLERANHIICDSEPWLRAKDGTKVASKYSDVSRDDIARLVSTLYHSTIHVSVCSTMALDGAVFDKPQIGPAYDDSPGQRYDRSTRELYMKEHYIPIVKSEGVDLAYNRDQLIASLNNAFLQPYRKSEQRKKMLEEVCTFTDGKSADRLASAIKKFLTSHSSSVR